MYTMGSTDWGDVILVEVVGVEVWFGKDALPAGLGDRAVKGVLGADAVAGAGVEDEI